MVMAFFVMICFAGVSVASPYQQAPFDLGDWFGIGWDAEVEAIDPEESNTTTIDFNRASVMELTRLSGVTIELARRIVKERQRAGQYRDKYELIDRVGISPETSEKLLSRAEFSGREPYQVRVRVRAARRMGEVDDANNYRYDGDPLGATEQIQFRSGYWEMGGLIAKDRYEPSWDDLQRFSISRSTSKYSLVAGDFHVSALRGVALRTRTVYAADFGSRSAFEWNEKSATPALDTQQNRALRGLAVEYNGPIQRGLLFLSRTELDAIVNDSGNVLRLSAGGLHRTEGETVKKNSVRESGIGGAWEIVRQLEQRVEARIGLTASYLSYSPPFQPEADIRIPYPLIGGHTSVVGVGGSLSNDGAFVGGEAAFDVEGGQVAGRIDFHGLVESATPTRITAALYHFPPDWNNPRGGSLAGNSSATNRQGGALSVSRRIRHKILKRWWIHFELERRPGRSYTIPTPSHSSKVSVETELASISRSRVVIRFRHKLSQDRAGEEEPVGQFRDSRLRLIWKTPLSNGYVPRLQLWAEAARVQSTISSGEVEASGTDEEFGGSTGVKLTLRSTNNNGLLGRISCYIGFTHFASTVGLPLYLGEGELPDRLSSIRLSGSGFRWSVATVYRQGRYGWFGLKAARTEYRQRRLAVGDLELYATLSWLFL